MNTSKLIPPLASLPLGEQRVAIESGLADRKEKSAAKKEAEKTRVRYAAKAKQQRLQKNMGLAPALFSADLSKQYCLDRAQKLREEQGEQLSAVSVTEEPSPFFYDSQGRPCFDRAALSERRRQDAFEKHQNNRTIRFNNGNFPKGAKRQFVFENEIRNTPALAAAAVSFNSCRALFLSGSVGTGKTSLAMRLALEWMEKDPTRHATFVSAAEWVQALFGRSGSDQEIGDGITSDLKMLRGKLIIIDDLDKYKPSEWVNIQMFRLIDHLERSGKRIILTANMRLEELRNRAGADGNTDGMIDRIYEMATAQTDDGPKKIGVHHFEYKSFRQ